MLDCNLADLTMLMFNSVCQLPISKQILKSTHLIY